VGAGAAAGVAESGCGKRGRRRARRRSRENNESGVFCLGTSEECQPNPYLLVVVPLLLRDVRAVRVLARAVGPHALPGVTGLVTRTVPAVTWPIPGVISWCLDTIRPPRVGTPGGCQDWLYWIILPAINWCFGVAVWSM
jgi:hypothetical protein